MKNTLDRILSFALCLVLILGSLTVLNACGNKNPEEPVPPVETETQPEESQTPQEPEKTEEPEEPEESEEPAYTGPVNPYTGLPEEADISAIRPYAVMINNIKVATPQWGITGADIMYEVLVEGGLTRLMGIYSHLEDVEIIGSIRSSRAYYLDLCQGYDAIYIHAGGSDEAYSEIPKRSINNIDGVRGSGVTFHRDSWRKANMGLEHSLMLDTVKVPDFVAKAGWTTELAEKYRNVLHFADEAKPEGAGAEKVNVIYSKSKSTSFEYDSENKVYMVSQYGSAMMDEQNDTQMSCKNILVLYTEMSKIPGDDKGRMKGTFTGSGTGLFICEGASCEINWSRAGAADPYVYTLPDGSPLELGRGVTYISIVAPSYGSVEME